MARLSDAALRREEKRYHPRLSRAFVLFIRRLRGLVSEKELERALATGNVNKVLELYSLERIEKQASPIAAIFRDAAVRIARVVAREV
jgi:hypothetical protein